MDKKPNLFAQKVQKFLKDNKIMLSAFGGYTCYELQDEWEEIYEKAIGEEKEGIPICSKEFSCIHILSGTLCQANPILITKGVWVKKWITQCEQYITNPPESSAFEWPVDLAVYKENDLYIYNLIYDMERKTLKKGIPLKKILYQNLDSKVLDWRHKDMQTLIKSFLRELLSFRKSGYLYLDYNINKIHYCKENQSFYFEFTRRIGETKGICFSYGKVPLKTAKEFSRPQLFQKDWDGTLKEYDDNFAITSILFRLMIGRLPYEGKGMDERGRIFHPEFEMDQTEYNDYFEKYHSYPCFIFDLEDENNSLGPMVENDLPRERWEALPETIKSMFRSSLSREAAERAQGDSYGPKEWLEVMQLL